MAMKKCKECGREVSTSAKLCPHCGKKHPTGGLTMPAKVFLVIFALFVLGKVVGDMGGSSTSTSSTAPSGPSPAQIKEQVKAQVIIKNLKWYKSGFDSVMMVNASFENKSGRDVKDIELTCDHFSNSGTKIDSNTRVIYEIVKAGKVKAVRDFNMGLIHSQAASTTCSITNLVLQ